MSCPICEKRKAERFCPAKGEKICALCCGREREVSIDCPADCPFLLSAHRYETEHPRDIPSDTPLLQENVPQEIIYTHQQLMTALAFSVAKFAVTNPSLTDADALSALQSLAETYKTLQSGIYYEKLPQTPLPQELYGALSALLVELKKAQAERGDFQNLKDSAIFHVLVFLYRMGLVRANGRPRSRRFIAFLRSQFPGAPELQREESRIIVP